MIWLISYPKSGANWIAYIIENVCNLRVSGMIWEKSLVYNKRVHNDTSKSIVHKSHLDKEKFGKQYNPRSDNLILTIRNYKECIPAQKYNKFDFEVFKEATKNSDHIDYIRPIDVFDKNENKKLLIRYEDLISNPEMEVIRISQFLSNFGGEIDYKDFIDNINSHKEESIKIYGKENSRTRGEKLIHYSLNISTAMRLKMDSYLIEKYPYLYTQYLKCYYENKII